MPGEHEHDVLVIGGGPAGSVAATALPREGLEGLLEGLRVRLIEGERFLRYHIGESLTLSCRTVLDVIGISKTLDAHGFVLKHGGAIQWDSDAWFFDWYSQMGVNSWQADRGAPSPVQRAQCRGVHRVGAVRRGDGGRRAWLLRVRLPPSLRSAACAGERDV